MNKVSIYFVLLLCIFGPLVDTSAQHYTYQTDRKFYNISDVIGYRFVPHIREVPGQGERSLAKEEFSFGVSVNYLYVGGGKIKGVYNINNIEATEYGYKLTTMNARNPMHGGHLKFILNEYGESEALIFRRSPKDSEIIFHIPEIPEHVNKIEKEYFSDLHEVKIESPDSLWGKKVYPFVTLFKVDQTQDRIQRYDSTWFHFYMTTEIIEKPIKPKKEKKKKKKKQKIVDSLAIDSALIAIQITDSLSIDSSAIDSSSLVKTKIIHTFYLEANYRTEYQDGAFEYKNEEYIVKRAELKTDEEASDLEDKHQILIDCVSGETFFLYLKGDYTLSSIDFNDRIYLLRGS